MTVLEFLSDKGNVIHGDISINNILINRVWGCSVEDSPSQLRVLAPSVNTVPKLGLESPHDRPRSDGDSIVERVPVLRLAPVQAPMDADYNGTFEPIEAAGMLIDYDLMRNKDEQSHQTSVCVSSKLS